MSEEILKALMQLFAIIAKQNDGSSAGQREFIDLFLRAQLNAAKCEEYLNLYDQFLHGSDQASPEKESERKLTSMKDSVRTLSICKKINKTLTQKQKVVVLIRLYEFICVASGHSEQGFQIISTVSEVFRIEPGDRALIEYLIFDKHSAEADLAESMLIAEKEDQDRSGKFIQADGLDGRISIIRIGAVGLYFFKYNGNSDIFLNGFSARNNIIYLLPQGATLRLPRGAVYYADIVSRFMDEGVKEKFHFTASDVSFRFKTGDPALRNISIEEEGGKLIGIMGGSGAGKTTLLNVLSGIETPSGGTVRVNGMDLHANRAQMDGAIGYISQDDLLFEDLTVYQNLFYNAELCHGDQKSRIIVNKTLSTLAGLGLQEAKDIKVGSPLNKMISGGQRKRLNISLELIREPPILFVDEPTSGLSSRDSENVMDLLKELSLRGKLIFVVIHQPSSDIYKMFDKVIILDKGGYQIYYGNPIEAVMYFKEMTNQLNSDIGECESCGNVNPETIFNIIESKEVDEYGNSTANRKISPEQWSGYYQKRLPENHTANVKTTEKSKSSFSRPAKFRQFKIFLKRDLVSKISNLQYIAINLLEAPLLAMILAGFIRYYSGSESEYVFRENENIPAYIFISVIVMLFFGLTVSAEEIFKDQKILKREQFLNLSKFSYLCSKIFLLFSISAIQSLLFALVGNWIIGIHGMFLDYFLVLFSVSAFANVIGLNISSAFNSAVTIYILIPLLIIPQMILGGAMISYDKINRYLGGGEKVPVLAEFMISRWGYEALMVDQFVYNKYEKEFYPIDKKISEANYILAYYIPELRKIISESKSALEENKAGKSSAVSENLETLNAELKKFPGECSAVGLNLSGTLLKNPDYLVKAGKALDLLNDEQSDVFNYWDRKNEELLKNFNRANGQEKVTRIRDDYSNDYLKDILCRTFAKKKVLRDNGVLVQVIDPIFRSVDGSAFISVHEPLFIPEKKLFGKTIGVLAFNVLVIWVFSLVGFVALYFGWLKKMLSFNPGKLFRRKAQL
ncbi:MAG: ATP-binding cassette domain-containing protein [Bacteroidia bacterium]